NCRDEWWHWSYGDNAWSVRTGCSIAVYGMIKPPPGYSFVYRPHPDDYRIGFRAKNGAAARSNW
ncbi:MAG: hypothetical protein V4671_23605, partial [Armatimonadota bacterium]